jgi:hypothetical protein
MRSSRGWRRTRLSAAIVEGAVGVVFVLVLSASPANAEAPVAPHWRLESSSDATNLPQNGEGEVIVSAANLGDGPVDGNADPATITDTLPAGLEATEVRTKRAPWPELEGLAEPEFECSAAPTNPVVCTMRGRVLSFEQVEILIKVRTKADAPAESDNKVTVSGGDTPASALSRPLKVDGAATGFGVERFEITPEDEEFNPDVQAGSHPFQLTTTIRPNERFELQATGFGLEALPTPPALVRNLTFKLPPGLIGDAKMKEANPVGQCSGLDFGVLEEGATNACPANTAVGVAAVSVVEPNILGYETLIVPLFNLTPAPGEPARFGVDVHNVPVVLDTSVRSGEGYGLTVSAHNISEAIQLQDIRVTFWGVPGDKRHDAARGWQCLGGGLWEPEARRGMGCTSAPARPQPFLTLPTSCGPMNSIVEGDAWNGSTLVGPSGEDAIQAESPTTLTGCDELPFDPTIRARPDKQSASTPTGLTVEVNVPQDGTLSANGLAEADIKQMTVALPEGMQASAGAANGLETCSVGQAGFAGLDGDGSPVLDGELEAQRFTPETTTCPDAAKIGTVDIKTPILPNDLTGSVYMAQQDTNPFASPLVLYLVAEEPASRVLVKLAGEVRLDPSTGQLTTTFKDTPQVPFEKLTLHLFDSGRASQTTPPLCGTYTTQSSLEPWSGTPAVSSPSTFAITSGANGGPCEIGYPQSFSPSFQAGPIGTQAGAFSPFTLTIRHPDSDQPLQSLTMHLPPGAAAMLSSLTPCPKPQASQGTCGPDSLIGHSTTVSGLGANPYSLPGHVFLTGPYEGAPFGLSVVTPAVAGPFNLGTVIVRSRIDVDPHTAAVTITSDPFPSIIRGVPLQIQAINLTVDRPGFQFNPTNCTSSATTGTLTGSQGASVAATYPWQTGNCASLSFRPEFTASTQGNRTVDGNGAGLKVKLSVPHEGPQVTTSGSSGSSGTSQQESNISSVKVELPKALPSRLVTLQKACTAGQFEANPANCPAASKIGYAVVHTPLLPVPVQGPAIFVSHGGEAFPSLILVLQGDGVTLDLVGTTFIGRSGITSTTFRTVPDVPFTTFELNFPQGKYSVLGANLPGSAKGSFCGQKLVMPTVFKAQNGLEIRRSTKIGVSGCPKAKTRVQLYAAALTACHKKHSKAKRATCERAARKKYRLTRKGKKK